MNPAGGTELQLKFLKENVSKELLDKFQICTSVPHKVPLSKDKINILWQKMAPDQPHFQEFFASKDQMNQYDFYVFNSHWNYEQFRKKFDIPTSKCTVIKNGIPEIKKRDLETKRQKIKLIYHPTPWRGLSILLGAMQLIKHPNVTLDVYSSTKVYGSDFEKDNDSNYQGLYDQAKKLPNVNYIGYKPNEYIKEHLKDYKIFAYPSIWEETFCISLLESMAAGLYCITTNYGAIPETGAEFPMYVPYSNNYKNLARKFAAGIEVAAQSLQESGIRDNLKMQKEYVNRFYNWESKSIRWTRFLQGAINAK